MKPMNIILASATCFSMAFPAQALDLGVSLGGTSVDVGAGLGGGSTASASVGVGSVGASVGVPGVNLPGTNGLTNIDPLQTAVSTVDLTQQQVQEFADRFLGSVVIGSDGVPLGQVIAFKPNSLDPKCPTLGIAPAQNLGLGFDRVWLQMAKCGGGGGEVISLSLTSGTFIKKMRR